MTCLVLKTSTTTTPIALLVATAGNGAPACKLFQNLELSYKPWKQSQRIRANLRGMAAEDLEAAGDRGQ